MDPRIAPNKRLDRRVRVEAMSDAIAALMQSDPAKVKVMGHFRELVADGFAEWQTLDDGTIRLRPITGETYLLEPAAITRIASLVRHLSDSLSPSASVLGFLFRQRLKSFSI